MLLGVIYVQKKRLIYSSILFIKALQLAEKKYNGKRPKEKIFLRAFVFKPTRPISVERSIVVWENWTWRVSIDVSVKWIVSVTRSVNTFGSCTGIVIDRFGVWP